jgi:hypothetical protein
VPGAAAGLAADVATGARQAELRARRREEMAAAHVERAAATAAEKSASYTHFAAEVV